MPAIIQTITITAAQGLDVISQTAYVSGDAKDIRSLDIQMSGLQSGVDINFTLSLLKSFTAYSTVGDMRMRGYSLSGSTFFDLSSGNPFVWWSGNGFTNPFNAASGNVIGFSFQQLSGVASGIVNVQVIKDATP